MDASQKSAVSLIESLTRVQPASRLGDGNQIQLQQHIEELVKAFAPLNEVEKRTIWRQITSPVSLALFWFAKRMAILAIRELSEERIYQGLVALVIENLAFDSRDSLTPLALLHHSSEKLGADSPGIFSRAAALARSEVAEFLKNFLNRPPPLRSIQTFGYREGASNVGFTYVPL